MKRVMIRSFELRPAILSALAGFLTNGRLPQRSVFASPSALNDEIEICPAAVMILS